MKKLILTLFSLFLAFPLLAAEPFKFTAIPDQDTARLEKRFNKIASYLSSQLDIDVQYIPVKSYSASVSAFSYNQVQLAWFGGLSGVRARLAVPGSQAIAQGEEDVYFQTYFIAHHSTGLEESKEFPRSIADKTFTFGSKGSTSGRLMPEVFLREHFEKSPRDVFSRVGFSGDHSKTIALVQSGAYQVGAVNFKVWKRELKEGNVKPELVKVIWKTPYYVDYNWTIRGDVDKQYGDGFSDRVQKALLEMKDPDLLASFPRKSFIEANNEMYQPILDMARQIGLIDQ